MNVSEPITHTFRTRRSGGEEGLKKEGTRVHNERERSSCDARQGRARWRAHIGRIQERHLLERPSFSPAGIEATNQKGRFRSIKFCLRDEAFQFLISEFVNNVLLFYSFSLFFNEWKTFLRMVPMIELFLLFLY